MAAIRNIFFIILMLTAIQSNAYSRGFPQDSLEYRNFKILYPKDQPGSGKNVLRLLQNHVARFDDFYGVKSDREIRILVAGSAVEFQTLANVHAPQWAAALYFPGRKQMVVKSPRWAGSLTNLEQHILHELSHAYFHEVFAGRKLPLWFNEGMAEYLSNARIDLTKALKLANAFVAHNLVGFEEINSLITFDSQTRAELAYLQSLSAFMFLQDLIGGRESMPAFQNKIVSDGWPAALQAATGMDDIDFEIAWHRHIRDEYRWLLILNLENLLWPAVILFLFIGFLVIRRRNKRKIRRWDAEESGESFSELQ